jgi:GT2 family glycosyltransferase
MDEIVNTFVIPIVRQDWVLDALKSLKLMTPHNYRTIVVNQTKPNRDFEEQLYASCDYIIRTHKNLGFAQASNLGIRLAPTEYVTVCNDDVRFIWPYWWHGIMESFRRYETAVCINPMSPKEPGWGYGEEGYRYHLTFEESQNPANILRLVNEKSGQMIDGLTCWCSVFKADALQEIGLFDERHFPGEGEDYDLMGRIYKAGHRALSTSLSWVWHWWGQSKDELDGFDYALPPARERWNRLDLLWPNGFDIWGKDPETQELLPRDSVVARMPL